MDKFKQKKGQIKLLTTPPECNPELQRPSAPPMVNQTCNSPERERERRVSVYKGFIDQNLPTSTKERIMNVFKKKRWVKYYGDYNIKFEDIQKYYEQSLIASKNYYSTSKKRNGLSI